MPDLQKNTLTNVSQQLTIFVSIALANLVVVVVVLVVVRVVVVEIK